MRVDAGRKCFVYLSVLAVALGLVLPAFFAPERARADSWVQEADAGFTGDFNRMQLDATATATFDDGSGSGPRLYVGTFNLQGTGCQVWRQDGPLPADWTQVNLDGFGDPNNIEVSGMAVFAHGGTTYLYVATQNGATGGEIWRTAGAGGAGGGLTPTGRLSPRPASGPSPTRPPSWPPTGPSSTPEPLIRSRAARYGPARERRSRRTPTGHHCPGGLRRSRQLGRIQLPRLRQR